MQVEYARTADGLRIACTSLGQGTPIVFAPPWVSHVEIMGAAFEQAPFLDWANLIIFDKRGTGLSDRDIADYSMDARLRDIEAVVAHFDLPTTAVWGLSEGGPMGIAYAAKHADRVSHLILQGTFANGTLFPREVHDAIGALVHAEWSIAAETFNNLFQPGASPDEQEFFRLLLTSGATPEDAEKMWAAIPEIDVRDLLGQINIPTLVIHSRGDKIVPYELGQQLAREISGAHLLTIDSDRHNPGADDLPRVWDAVTNFLRPEPEAVASPSALSQGGVRLVLFTDVEASTDLTDHFGDAKARDLLREHERLTREALAQHGGTEIKTMGDGFMAAFTSASGALDAAIAMQRAMHGHFSDTATPLRIRVGINAGEPIEEDDDLYGTAVIQAARVMAKANGAQILVTDTVRNLVAGKPYRFSDHGSHDLKGFEEPARLFDVAWQA